MIGLLKKYIWRPIFQLQLQIRIKYENKYIIPPYAEKRRILLDYQKKFKCKTFVETGTFLGDTIENVKNNFDYIYSFELAEELAERAKKRFQNDDHIKIITGDSGLLIKEVMHEWTTPVLYWLDGHYSSSFFLGEEFIKTASGEKSTPILNELTAILKNGLQDNVILIDDARCFGKTDYPSIKELIAFVSKHGVSSNQVTVTRDIIRIIPAEK